MKSIQKVSYTQIKENIMPLGFHRIILSKTFRPSHVPEKKIGSFMLYYDDQKLYSTDCAVYICGSEDSNLLKVLNYFSFIVLAGKYVSTMVSIMSDLYKRADAIVKDMDSMDESTVTKEQFTTLKKSIVETDFIRRDCSERYGKIQQATKNFEYKEHAYSKEKFTGEERLLSAYLNISEAFDRIKCDSDYLILLWRDVLIKNLENLSFAVKARISFQESLDTKREQKEMRLLRYITVLSLAVAVVRLGSISTLNKTGLVEYSVLAMLISGMIIAIVEFLSGYFRKK